MARRHTPVRRKPPPSREGARLHQKLQEARALRRRLLQRRRAAVWTVEFIGNADPRYPELIVPLCPRVAVPATNSRRRLEPYRYVSRSQGRHTAPPREGPSGVSCSSSAPPPIVQPTFVLSLDCENGPKSPGDRVSRIATADAVVAERVIDVRISEAARGVEQHVVVDHITGSATQRAKPIDVAF